MGVAVVCSFDMVLRRSYVLCVGLFITVCRLRFSFRQVPTYKTKLGEDKPEILVIPHVDALISPPNGKPGPPKIKPTSPLTQTGNEEKAETKALSKVIRAMGKKIAGSV